MCGGGQQFGGMPQQQPAPNLPQTGGVNSYMQRPQQGTLQGPNFVLPPVDVYNPRQQGTLSGPNWVLPPTDYFGHRPSQGPQMSQPYTQGQLNMPNLGPMRLGPNGQPPGHYPMNDALIPPTMNPMGFRPDGQIGHVPFTGSPNGQPEVFPQRPMQPRVNLRGETNMDPAFMQGGLDQFGYRR